jgi:hypothetical protein
MDTRTPVKSVDQQISDIKAYMPNIYAAIQARAKQVPGTFREVRLALDGQPNLFYAFERDRGDARTFRTVGTPFTETGIMSDLAEFLQQFSCAHVCIWSKQKEGQQHGAN